MSTIPKTIEAGHLNLTVLPTRKPILNGNCPTEPGAIAHPGQTALAGRFYRQGGYVEVSVNQCADEVANTLYHEMVHVAGELAGLHDHPEEWIEKTTPHLIAILRKNPDLVAYLLDPDPTHVDREIRKRQEETEES